MEKIVKKWLKRHPEITFATLFGSFAAGRENSDSDVDLAIMGSHLFSTETKVKYALELNSELGKEVDLIDLNDSHGLILKEALSNGKILVNENKDAYAFLIKKMLFEEADFGPLRDRILKERRMRVLKTNS